MHFATTFVVIATTLLSTTLAAPTDSMSYSIKSLQTTFLRISQQPRKSSQDAAAIANASLNAQATAQMDSP
jgi:hypothetical protein